MNELAELPSGTVTFLFTDIEGSTRLWEQHPQVMRSAISRHDVLLRAAVEENGGTVVKTTGDGLHAVFDLAMDAVGAALAAQRALMEEPWDATIGQIRARMALYTGAAQLRDGDYYGPAVNRVARLLSAGHGGQTLLSQATQELVRDEIPEQVALVDLGEHRLRDVARPEHLYQIAALDLPAQFPPLKSLDARRTNLPSQPTPFIGRESELAAVGELIKRDDVRLVTLLGPGGIGKTRLALQAASESLANFEEGVFFVDLAPVAEPDLVASTIARALNLREMGGQMLVETLKQHLSSKRMLLVLDNFEHLLDAADILPELLRAALGLELVVTSREALNLHEEWLYPVGGLPFPSGDHDADLASYGAVKLFVDSARRVRPDFSLSDDANSVVRICQLSEGMPLAIELAASWTRTLSSRTIANEIEQGIDFLATRLRNVPERHQSMRSVFDYSWQLLTREEQTVFKRLSVFIGGFERAAAKQVAGASLPVLSALLDKTLLRWVPGSEQALIRGRYRVHELLRQYGREQLEASPEEANRILDLHSAYYAEFLQQREEDIIGASQSDIVREISADFENVRAAWSWAVEQKNLSTINRAAYSLAVYCDFQGRFQTYVQGFERAVETLEEVEPSAERELLLATLLAHLGYGYIRLGRFEAARVAFEHSRAIYNDLDATPHKGFATDPLGGLALLAITLGDYVEAISLGDEARRQCEKRADQKNLQIALYVLSDASFALGRYDNAKSYAQQAYSLTQETKNRWMMAYVLTLMGNVSRALGDNDQARRQYQASYAIKQEFNDPEGMAAALNRLARIAWLGRDYQEAEQLYGRSLAKYQEINDPGGLAVSLQGLGDTALAVGDYRAARRHILRALEIASDIGWVPLSLSILTSISQLLQRAGRWKRSAQLLALVYEHPATDQMTKEQAEQGLARVEAELPLEELAAAREQGRVSTLEAILDPLFQELTVLALGPSGEVPAPTATGQPEVTALVDPLTPRELEVLQLIAAGLTNPEIADKLVIAVGTVKSYTGQIYSKLNVNSRTQAVARARELELLEK